MTIYRYDGGFEGFLCGVALALDAGERYPGFLGDDAEAPVPDLFSCGDCDVPTARDIALAFRGRFIDAVSQDAFATARYAFHSRKAGVEQLLWRYLKLGLEAGPRLTLMLTEEPVLSVNRIARRVSHEAHKFKGFVRFREVQQGFLYAAVEPEADVVPLIAPHFTGRVGDRPWMIHDLQRGQAAVFDLRSWRMVRGVELTAEPDDTTAECCYAALWRRYFEHHAIPERHNPGLQLRHVPLRYRKQLTEFTAAPEVVTVP